jgi:hypothetical protein
MCRFGKTPVRSLGCHAEVREPVGKAASKKPGVHPGRVEVRIEHGDVRTARPGSECSQEVYEFFRAQPSRSRAIDGGHDRRIEHVDIDMQPVTVQFTPSQNSAYGVRGSPD